MLTRALIALALTALGVFGWQWATHTEVRDWLVITSYVLIYAALALVQGALSSDSRSSPTHGRATPMPVSGPIRALGVYGLSTVWTVSQSLALLNPRQMMQTIRQIRGNRQAAGRLPSSPPEHQATAVLYSLPFEGEWVVMNGGLSKEDSHSWEILAQRYAHDFVVADADLARHSARGNRVGDYFSYDQPVLASADGVVIATESGIRDAPLVGWGFCDFLARSFIGNYILIQHAESEFALYAHLVRDSITVESGSRVTRGQCIGRCGHSGHSSEPHLHFHVQDRADLFSGLGKPVRFGPAVIDNEEVTETFLRPAMRVASKRN